MTANTTPPTESPTVAIIGAGPAGCAAGVFCARAEFETLVISHGRSTLNKCAFLENYLGFPLGISPQSFLDLSRRHAEEAGCRFIDGVLQTVTKAATDGRFELTVDEGNHTADYVIATSWANSDFFEPLAVETTPESESSSIEHVVTNDNGKTAVDGVYAAGRITNTHHQALVNAGDGARVGVNLIKHHNPEFYNDWVASEGYYAEYDREVPPGVEEISHEERQHRTTVATEWLVDFFISRETESKPE